MNAGDALYARAPFRPSPEAPCVGQTELFFNATSARKGPAFFARRLCRECPHQEACLGYAILGDEAMMRMDGASPGIWGGATPQMLSALTRKSNRGRDVVTCSVRGCTADADFVLSANVDEIVCEAHAEGKVWR